MGQYTYGIIGQGFRYSAFGIQIDSEIMLPNLPQGNGGASDVRILLGNVPDRINLPLTEAVNYQATECEFLFQVDGVARYYVTNGEQITVQLCSQADLRTVILYLLGTSMGVLLMQRGIVPIHGSTVVINGQGVLFTGESGAGKSTVAAALLKNGYHLLADDISAVIFDKNGVPWVQPGYPQQKLWQASASMIGIDTNTLDRISGKINKYAVPILTGFRRQPIPIAVIYEIDVKPCDDVTMMPLAGMEKLATIMANTYRAELVNGLGLKIVHFQKCATLAKYIQLFRLTRPENEMSLDRQVNVLEQHFAYLFAKGEKS